MHGAPASIGSGGPAGPPLGFDPTVPVPEPADPALA
jgi:hypothetical protein